MNKEALGTPANVGPGYAGGGAAGMHLLNKLRAQNESIDLNKTLLDAESEARDVVAEELVGKEAAVAPAKAAAVAKTVGEALKNALSGRWPNVTQAAELAVQKHPGKVLAGTLGAGLGGGALVESYFDKQREKKQILEQYVKRRQLLEGAPQFRDAEDLLGMAPEELNELLGRNKSTDVIKQPSAPSEIDVATQREEPIPMVEDPYAELLKSANVLAGAKKAGKGYLDLLRGTKAKGIKADIAGKEQTISAVSSKGSLGPGERTKLISDVQDVDKLKKALIKARLQQAGTIAVTAAVPVGIGIDQALVKNVSERNEAQKAASNNILYKRLKSASEKLKKNVSGDTVIKEKGGEMEIQDVAITKTKDSMDKKAWEAVGGGLTNLMAKSAGPLTAGEWSGGGYNPMNWLSRGTDAALGPASQKRKMAQVNKGTYKPGMLAGKRSTPKAAPVTPTPANKKPGTSIDSISGGIKDNREMIRELSK